MKMYIKNIALALSLCIICVNLYSVNTNARLNSDNNLDELSQPYNLLRHQALLERGQKLREQHALFIARLQREDPMPKVRTPCITNPLLEHILFRSYFNTLGRKAPMSNLESTLAPAVEDVD